MPGKLSTHVLDTAHGCPANNMVIDVWWRNGNSKALIKTVRTNSDGRTDEFLLGPHEIKEGQYELVFYVGDYFLNKIPPFHKIPFLDTVPVRFGISDVNASYHVPLLCSPWSYSTYRGS